MNDIRLVLNYPVVKSEKEYVLQYTERMLHFNFLNDTLNVVTP